MLCLVVLFAFIDYSFVGALPRDWEGRIVNGKDTTIETHPYQVSLQTIDGKHICGGSIINKDTIVTAAHCVQTKKPFPLKVRLGSTLYNKGGKLVDVRALKYHEFYNPITMAYDVAILKLKTPVQESSTIRFIKLSQETPANDTTAVVTGWGSKCFLLCKKTTQVLQAVQVGTMTRQDCGSNKFRYGKKIQKTMFCAYGVKKDSCQGDSGGPLVAKSKLIGIVSWGKNCANKDFPGIYSNVAVVKDWIVRNAKEL